jgi:hypothetical protein
MFRQLCFLIDASVAVAAGQAIAYKKVTKGSNDVNFL